MSLPGTNVELSYADVVAGVPISVPIQTYSTGEIYVLYGTAKTPATPGVHYAVALVPGFATINVTPTAALTTLMGVDNQIYVGRSLPLTTDFDEDDSFVREKTVIEFDRVWMALQQIDFGISEIIVGAGGSDPLKANLASPTFTGVPAAPTAAPGTNTTQLATTAFTTAAIAVVLGGVSAAFDTLSEIAAALALKAPLASPALTGTPTAPTAAPSTNNTQLATTGYVDAAVALVGGGGGSGDVVGPVSATADNPAVFNGITGKIIKEVTYAVFKASLALNNVDNTSDANKPVSTATQTALSLKAPLASPALTGTPTAPTAAGGTNTTQIATTAFVTAAMVGAGSGNVVGPASATDDLPVIFDGTTGKLIKQKTYAAFKTLLVLVKGDVGLGSVDNTADTAKPVSTAQQTALNLKADLAGPTFTGVPAAPTAAAATSTTQLATTAFVTTADNLKANIASPTFTGVPAAPTAAGGTNTTQLATTAFVTAAVATVLGGVSAAFDTLSEIETALNLKAPLASPTFTGTPAAPTAAAATNTTQVATTAFVQQEITAKAPLASPTFTGDPKAPTPTAGDNDTSIATTAYVMAKRKNIRVTLTDGATPALDASLGDIFNLTAAGDRTIGIPTNPADGQKIVIHHLASAGARTLALNAGTGGFRFGSTITALTATISAKTDYIGAIYDLTDNKWDVVAYVKGF